MAEGAIGSQAAHRSRANPGRGEGAGAACGRRLRGVARVAAACGLGVALAAGMPAESGTPDGTVVMAKDIDDMIGLDPAEVFELSAGEVIANIYDRIMMFEPDNLQELVGGVAESHEISTDGRTIIFRIRPGQTFHSGNPLRPEDVEFSLERVVKLNKTPAFIVNQFGWTPDTVEDLVEVVDDRHVSITLTEDFSPDLVLNALSAGIGSVVDKELVLSHEQDGDLGHGWLRTNSAGSGPFRLERWQANDAVVLSANPDYRHGAPGVEQVVLQHAPEARQRELLEQGEVDVARDLAPEQIEALAAADDIAIDRYPAGGVIYLAANASHPILGKPDVMAALRYAVDYDGMAETFLAGQYAVHQAFWPRGLWAAHTETPYQLDIPAARKRLEAAGHGGGFSLRIDTLEQEPYPAIARSIQASLAQLGIEVTIRTRTGADLWPYYRSERRHELILAPWSPDYVDPHSNADSFAYNPDNRQEAQLGGKLAWRNAWVSEPFNAMVLEARQELDRSRRKQLYLALQQRLQHDGPYVVMFQQNVQVARQRNVQGLVAGPNFDLVYYRGLTK